MQPIVDIQIVNYQTKEYLKTCLTSLHLNNDIQMHIYIADNASRDDLSEIQALFPQVHITYLPDNRGFGAAHNFLATQGHSPYILILNPDTVFLDKKTLATLLATLSDNHRDAVGPKLVTNQGTAQAWDHGELQGIRPWVAQKLGSSYWQARTQPGPAAWISGACLLVRREAFEKVGGFDEAFFLYKEDDDLGLRLRQAGYRLIYNPWVKVQHQGSVIASEQKYMYQSERLFIHKHCRGLWQKLAYVRLALQARLQHYQTKL